MPGSPQKGIARPRQRRQPTRKVLSEIYANIRLGCSIEMSAHICNVDPEDLQSWMANDKSIYRRVMKETSLFEKELLLKAKEGGKTICASRAALQLLSSVNMRFANKQVLNVRREFDKVLDELERQLPEETFLKVLHIIETHAK